MIAPFVADYRGARTPIPCVHCNGDLKFRRLLDRASGLEADGVATGHYARVERRAGGEGQRAGHVLRRARDRAKDQSYFLFSLTQDQLARAHFPLGELTKDEVRDYARSRGLAVADKPDSHEICFVPDGDYAAFVERRAGERPRPGPMKDAAGRVLGRHGGVHRFTVGQRKGLGLGGPVRLYVTALEAETGTVTVGPREALERTALAASRVNWISAPPSAGQRGVGADPAPTPGGGGARLAPGRGASPAGVRRAAGGRRTGSGGRALRRGRGPRRRLDRLGACAAERQRSACRSASFWDGGGWGRPGARDGLAAPATRPGATPRRARPPPRPLRDRPPAGSPGSAPRRWRPCIPIRPR